jgi:hypothetical protein
MLPLGAIRSNTLLTGAGYLDRMGMFIAAIALVASLVSPPAAAQSRKPASAKATPQTLYAAPSGTIQAFAQDGPLLAWFAPGTKKTACNSVRVLSLDNGGQIRLPDQTSTAPNVTCRWDVAPPVNLALAGSDVLWTLREKQAPVQFDYVLGAGIADRRERRFQEVAHARRGAGLWLGGIAGDSIRTGPDTISTLVYGTTSVQFVDEIACLSGGSCDMKISGGGVYRVIGRKAPELVPNTGPAVEVAVSGPTVAYVPAASAGANGMPLAAADLPVELVDVRTGRRVAHVSADGTPLAIALAPHVLVMLERAPAGLTLAWYSTTTGEVVGSVAVPADTLPELSATDQQAVFRIGSFIHVLTFATGHSRTVAQTVGTPIGVSLEGNRLAWAENVKGHGRIRALFLNGRG